MDYKNFQKILIEKPLRQDFPTARYIIKAANILKS